MNAIDLYPAVKEEETWAVRGNQLQEDQAKQGEPMIPLLSGASSVSTLVERNGNELVEARQDGQAVDATQPSDRPERFGRPSAD